MADDTRTLYDVCIVGAGPAGLSAALILARCKRRVLMYDSGRPRNGASRALHGFLTRDGTSPMMLRQLGREEVAHYPRVELHENVEITRVDRREERFEIHVGDAPPKIARILLLATGRIDLLPETPGFREFYGRGVYHCPVCDGWEHHDEPLVAFGAGEPAYDIALTLLVWSPHVTLCSNGPSGLTERQQAKLRANGVRVIETRVTGLRGNSTGVADGVLFAEGEPLACGAVFFCSDCPQRSPLAVNLGCKLDAEGSVICRGHAATNVPGLYVAGNVRGGIHLAVVAAAEGAEAALAINRALHEHDLR